MNIAVYRILRALAKITIPLGMSATMMSELVRCAYVDAAEDLIKEKQEKIQITKICAMTGLYRKEIIRLRSLPPLSDVHSLEKYNRTTRIVSGWLRDHEFHTASGRPAVLDQSGDGSFADLVNRYSGGMAPKAMLKELVRLGIVSVNSRDQVKLLASGYIATMPLEAVEILGIDTADLIETIHYNTLDETDERRFQRKVTYKNLPQQHVQSFRKYAASESQKLLEKLDRWLAKRDANTGEKPVDGSRVGLGIYHVEKHISDEPQSKDTDND